MYRNRFKKKAVSRTTSSTVSNAGDSSVVSLSSTAVTTDNEETSISNASATKTQTRNKTPGSKKKPEEFPTEKSFLSPAPSPKMKTPTRRAPMRESNASSPVLNVTRRKPRRAQDPELPFFNSILASCGLKFEPEGDEPHILDQEQIYFVRDFQEAIEKPENKNKVKDFVDQFVTLHDNDTRLLKKSLMPTKRMIQNVGYATHDSLTHLLLEVPQMQDQIFDFLNSKLLENVSEGNERRTNEGLNCVQWTKLLLHQLVDLTFVENAEQITSKLLECFTFCQSSNTQKEFLHAFPSVIYVGNQQEVVKCLSKVLKESGEITPQLLDALCDMAASQEDRDFITASVVNMLKNGSRKFIPEVVSFLLAHARYESDKAQIIQQLRQNAELTPFGINEAKLAEDKAMLKRVVAQIGCGLNAMQEVGDLWLNIIANTPNLKPIDVIVLICMVSEGKKKKILSLVKSKCAAGALSENLIDTTFEHHGQALCEYFDNIVEIASFLIKVQDKFISFLGGHWFKLLFLHLEAPYMRQKLLWCLINLLGVNSARATESVLVTLSNLVKNHMSEILPQASLLMVPESLLDKVEIVSLEHARKIMDIICQLAYSGHSQADMLQSDINILIQKQLRSLDNQNKRKGIVGAIMATKHIAVGVLGNNDTNFDDSLDGQSTTSSERSSVQLSFHLHPAQCLIDLAFKNTMKSPELRGFLHDELANMLNSSVIDRSFQEWLHASISAIFSEQYFISKEDLPKLDLPKDVKLTTDLHLIATTGAIIASIGDHVVQDAMKASAVTSANSQPIAWPAVNMCPMFRLTRILSFQVNVQCLSEMDATLVCPVLIPMNMLQISRAEFSSISNPLVQISILDSLFIAVNWFRELISAFCAVESGKYEEKLFQRIRHITYLESKILELMPVFPPEYVPPASQFYADVIPYKRGAAGKKPKSKKKSKRKKKPAVTQSSLHPALDDVDFDVNGNEDEDTDFQEEETELDLSKEYSLKDLSAYFRELDITIVIRLLQHCLVIDDEPQDISNPAAKFGPVELVFILEDMRKKLEHCMDQKPGILGSKSSKPFPFAFGADDKLTSSIKANATLHFHLDLLDTKVNAANFVAPMGAICDKLEQVVKFFKDLQEKNDGLKDGPGSETEKSKLLQKSMFLMICCLKSALGWSGLYEKENFDIAEEILTTIAKRAKREEEMTSKSGIVSLACEYIANFGECILTLPTAVEIVELLQVINSHDPDQSGELAKKNRKLIFELACSFMRDEWPSVPKEFGSEVQMTVRLIQARYATGNKPLIRCVKLLKYLVENAGELKGKNGGKISKMPLFSRASLPSIFKVLSKTLVETSKAAIVDAETATQNTDLFETTYDLWEVILEGLIAMRDVAKEHETKALFTAFFKDSQPILRFFMDNGLPLMEEFFSEKYEKIKIILKKVQSVTKYIHSLCTHGKITNQLGLVTLVPNMRFLMEKLVLRVKAMLVLHDCGEMFDVGNLKNYNLKGESISSQIGGDDSEDEDDKKVSQKRKIAQKSQKSSKSQAPTKLQTQRKSQASTSQIVAGKKLVQKTQMKRVVEEKEKASEESPQSSSKKQKRVVSESDSSEEEEAPSSKKRKQQAARKVVSASEEDEEEEEDDSPPSSPIVTGKKRGALQRKQSSEDEEVQSPVKKKSKDKSPMKRRLFHDSGVEEEGNAQSPAQEKRGLNTSIISSALKRGRKIYSSDSD
ncbi:Fanconi anemia group D2 protein [Cloeon dipterum]|uniref:Fanconi anemia group D2 protein n=1 Tax=Cloeon dipterum TaxID=197152 RepID=UPI00321FB4FB